VASQDVLDTLGHTSGWDCVAGVLTATECWLTAHPTAPCGETGRRARGIM